MGTQLFSLSPFTHYYRFLINPNIKPLQNPIFLSKFRRSSSSRRKQGFSFDAFYSRRFEFEDEFGRRREKRRNWWSDEDDDDDDDDMEFGFWDESPNSINWIFKLLKAFGWIVPTVMVSSLLGTGSNSIIMALVLPLGQTVLTLVMDKMWGGPSSEPTSRSRPRPRSKSKSRSRSRPRSKRNPSHPGPMNGSYQSWAAANFVSSKKSGGSSSYYGGWDELDQHVVNSNSFTEEQKRKFESLQKVSDSTGKLSRRIYRDKPLFLRLLFAVFPFLGSWTRFLF